LNPLERKPSRWQVATCLVVAALAMAVAVYFAGTGRTAPAMLGTVIFVVLGGLGFDLARRRSL
jgi:hypothetical protein